jgi:SNARE domain.
MQQLQQEDDLEHLKKRHDSIKKIERMIGEIGGIFQRISTLVQMHETMIER